MIDVFQGSLKNMQNLNSKQLVEFLGLDLKNIDLSFDKYLRRAKKLARLLLYIIIKN